MTSLLHELTAHALAEGYRAGTFSPLDALDAVEAQLDRANPSINAIVAEDRVAARNAAARSAERFRAGAPLSALDGVPMSIKDNLKVAGLRATWGSALHRDFVPDTDEGPVARLRHAGGVFIGKSNAPEFTLQGYTDNLLFGPTQNPIAPGCTPGGSTGGGAAAVAAGIGPIAIGTDGGGSLRRPAAHCGLWGFKASIGQIARWGGFPQILADFEVVGPIARSPADLRAVFDVLACYDPIDPRTRSALAPPRPFPACPRIGVFTGVGDAPVDPQIVAAAEQFAGALAAGGCDVTSIDAPFSATRVTAAWSTIATASVHWLLRDVADLSILGANAQAFFAMGAMVTGSDYVAAYTDCLAMRAEAATPFERFDLLLCPSTAALAWPATEPFPATIAGRDVGPRGHSLFATWMNVAGVPAVAVPVKTTPDAGGIGVQLVAAAGRDRDLLHFVIERPALRDWGKE